MVAFAPTETFAKPIHAVLSNSPLSNYWGYAMVKRLRHGARSFPRRQDIHRDENDRAFTPFG